MPSGVEHNSIGHVFARSFGTFFRSDAFGR